MDEKKIIKPFCLVHRDAKKNLVKAVNTAIADGVPLSLVKSDIQEVLTQISAAERAEIARAEQTYKKQLDEQKTAESEDEARGD